MLEQKDFFFFFKLSHLENYTLCFYQASLDKSEDKSSSDVSGSRTAALKGTSWPLQNDLIKPNYFQVSMLPI